MGADGGGVKSEVPVKITNCLPLPTFFGFMKKNRNLLMSKSGIIAIVLLMLRLDRSKLLKGTAGRTLCIRHHTIPCHTILCNNVLCYNEECRLDLT